MGQVKSTLEKLKKFKKKYYTNLLIRGGIFAAALILSLFLIFNYLEFWFHLNKTFRQTLFFGFLILVAASFYFYIVRPLSFLLNFKKQISDERAAEIIGQKFTFINDKLLNAIQLLKYSEDNPLAAASLYQREVDYKDISFSRAINFKENLRFLKYLIIPLLCLILVLLLFPSSLVESTNRIINYNKTFAIPAPFQFILLNKDLKAFRDEDFTVDVEIEGKALPEIIYLNNNGRKYKMENKGDNKYTFTFKKLQGTSAFFIEGAGYNSEEYVLNVVNRPLLFDLGVELKYPSYLNKKSEVISNAGNLTVPEGTNIKWNFNTLYADSVLLTIDKQKVAAIREDKERFTYSRKIKDNSEIKIDIKNGFAESKDDIFYQINVIKDQYPQININTKSDTILFNNLMIGGNAADDYGISKLQLVYQVKDDNTKSEKFKYINIPFTKNSPQQNFYMNWKLDSFNLKPGEKLEYFVQVWDNDGVNGAKSTKSSVVLLEVPEKEAIKETLAQGDKKTESDIEKALKDTESLRKELSNIKEDLKVKKKASWQDQKKLEELSEKKQQLEEQIKKLQEENSGQNLQKEKFLNPDEKILEKLKMLEKLMNNLLDEETKKLYEQLQKLLKEQNMDQVPDLLEKINKKEMNLEKELERALEMFKKMEFEQKLENTVEELKELKEEQKKLSEETLKNKKANQDSLVQKQEELMQEFKEKEKAIEELKEMNQDLENSNPMEDTKEEEEAVKENQEKSLEDLKNNKNKKSSEKQSKAAEQMQKISEKLEEMQSGMEMEAQEENIENLRDILENLLTLSFEQESLMKDFKNVNQSDPRYITLSQKQLKIKDDAKIIEDSLLSLAKRVFQIESFVTREVGAMNENIEESLDNLKKRRPAVAAAKQQFAMKSMNELALLLNDVLKQMQEQMANAKGSGKKSKGKKKSSSPGLSELQKQLNEQIQQLMKSGKSGKELSEGLAEMAAKQEMIRQALEKLKKSGGNTPGGNLDKLTKEMEKTEEDLVNKRLGQQTINRQKEILTRLLESEKSQKERDQEEKREATSAKQIEKQFEDKYSEYLKLKEKEIEFIKTLPPSFNSYYKTQVNNYFKSIKN